MNKPKSSFFRHYKISDSDFDIHTLTLFQEQASKNEIYREYLEYINCDVEGVTTINKIPFLPIDFFKYHSVKTNDWQPEKVFESSGTTGILPSKHYVKSISAYHLHAQTIFEEEFGPIHEMIIIGLLPSYLERNNSSLVSMVDFFITESKDSNSGFYLNEYERLINLLQHHGSSKRIVLFGVSFALLDLAEQYSCDLSNITVVETGGMKGRREEIVKQELYETLKNRLGIKQIYSEYGMTELLSQAYGKNGILSSPKSMRVLIRDINDPYEYVANGRTGGINIIDLANEHTCCFIETKDLGRILPSGQFEVLGRFDNSDIRGCNLLIA